MTSAVFYKLRELQATNMLVYSQCNFIDNI